MQETQVWLQVRKIPWRRKWQPTPVFLPGESHGQRNLMGYNPWGHKELDTTDRLERAHTHTHTHHLFHLTSSCSCLGSLKETSIQIWARWCFGTPVHHLHLLAFQIKSPLLTPALHFWIHWPVMGQAWCLDTKASPGSQCRAEEHIVRAHWSFLINLWGLSKSLLWMKSLFYVCFVLFTLLLWPWVQNGIWRVGVICPWKFTCDKTAENLPTRFLPK